MSDDLLTRSSAHWSEAGRVGMDAFYRLATDDYRHLAEARDWAGWFRAAQARAGDRSLRLLDVACGSGKFPNALARHAGLAEAGLLPVETALLDPSAFSIAEARAALPPPFRPAAEYETTLQGLLAPPEGGFDIVWATHAIYAVPETEVDLAAERFLAAMAPGGQGVIAHSAAAGHYVEFHRRYLAAFGAPDQKPYISAETVADAFLRAGANVTVDEVRYASVAGPDDAAAVEGYLQRCVFDDSVPMAEMEAREPVADYLAGCQGSQGWQFPQVVHLMTIAA